MTLQSGYTIHTATPHPVIETASIYISFEQDGKEFIDKSSLSEFSFPDRRTCCTHKVVWGMNVKHNRHPGCHNPINRN